MEKSTEEITKQIIQQRKQEHEQSMIDSIIAIYNQEYTDYQKYVDEIQKINNDIYKMNHDDFNYYIYMDYMPIVAPELFEYIKKKGEDQCTKDKMQKETIRILKTKCHYNIYNDLATPEEMEIVEQTLMGK